MELCATREDSCTHISGLDDSMAPVKSSQEPMYEALGTPKKHHIPYPGGHVDFINRQEVIKKALDWLNEYLAPVNQN